MMNNKLIAALKLYGEAWAVEANALDGLVAQLQLIPAEAMYLDRSNSRAESEYQVVDGVAEIRVTGPMAKDTTSLQSLLGVCSTVSLRRQVRHADANSAVKEIALIFDSPGGQVAGTAELALDVQHCSTKTTAYIDGSCCSAAYWVASQCDSIVCSPFAVVGSIGCYSVMLDSSEAAASEGLRVILVSSGGVKGHPTAGVAIPEEAISARQEYVNDVMTMFSQFVSHGRGMSLESVSEVSDGRVWNAEEAKELGLVDSVELWDTRSNGETEEMNILDLFKPKQAAKAEVAEAETALPISAENLELLASPLLAVEPTPEQKAFAEKFIDMKAAEYLTPFAANGKVLNLEVAKTALVEAYKADNGTLVNGDFQDGTLVSAVKALIECQPDRSTMFVEQASKMPEGAKALSDKPEDAEAARAERYRKDNNLPEKK